MEALFDRLQDVARNGKTIRYEELGEEIGLEMNTLAERTQLTRILTDVARQEHEAGRPLLTAVVVNEQGMPGYEFFSVASDLGFEVGSYDAPFFREQLAHVHEYWRGADTE